MFTTPNEAIAYALRTSKLMIHRFLDDLKPAEFEHQPLPGANCAAWIVGHLTLTDRRTLLALGGTDNISLPADFAERFAATRAAASKQSGYGDPKELMRFFDAYRDRLIETVLVADVAKFREAPSMQVPMFSDKGEMTMFMGLHTAFHMGQVTLIRRSLGYPPLA